ncbi:hypothetical protein HK101_000925 [Irineochytrium annulatum]|nr:hypothetical protein HK101_000925 [Irineochytrium annulatum]
MAVILNEDGGANKVGHGLAPDVVPIPHPPLELQEPPKVVDLATPGLDPGHHEDATLITNPTASVLDANVASASPGNAATPRVEVTSHETPPTMTAVDDPSAPTGPIPLRVEPIAIKTTDGTPQIFFEDTFGTKGKETRAEGQPSIGGGGDIGSPAVIDGRKHPDPEGPTPLRPEVGAGPAQELPPIIFHEEKGELMRRAAAAAQGVRGEAGGVPGSLMDALAGLVGAGNSLGPHLHQKVETEVGGAAVASLGDMGSLDSLLANLIAQHENVFGVPATDAQSGELSVHVEGADQHLTEVKLLAGLVEGFRVQLRAAEEEAEVYRRRVRELEMGSAIEGVVTAVGPLKPAAAVPPVDPAAVIAEPGAVFTGGEMVVVDGVGLPASEVMIVTEAPSPVKPPLDAKVDGVTFALPSLGPLSADVPEFPNANPVVISDNPAPSLDSAFPLVLVGMNDGASMDSVEGAVMATTSAAFTISLLAPGPLPTMRTGGDETAGEHPVIFPDKPTPTPPLTNEITGVSEFPAESEAAKPGFTIAPDGPPPVAAATLPGDGNAAATESSSPNNFQAATQDQHGITPSDALALAGGISPPTVTPELEDTVIYFSGGPVDAPSKTEMPIVLLLPDAPEENPDFTISSTALGPPPIVLGPAPENDGAVVFSVGVMRTPSVTTYPVAIMRTALPGGLDVRVFHH